LETLIQEEQIPEPAKPYHLVGALENFYQFDQIR